MSTELTDIQKWLRIYKSPGSFLAYRKALMELEKVHDKYGTIDINIIKSLIN